MLNIVLVEPEIPQNTGNIARTCAVTGARLHLIEPLGFSISDKQLKRAGLDYWHFLDVKVHADISAFWNAAPEDAKFFYFTSKGQNCYTTAPMTGEHVYLLFGPETRGLPEEMLIKNPERCVRIPMREGARCLNLSNSVAVAAYEALRQDGFQQLEQCGPFPL